MSDSYVQIDSKRLLELCEKQLKYIADSREQHIKNMVQWELQDRNSIWWRRWFKRFLTEEKIEEELATRMSRIRIFLHEDQEELVKRLQIAAKEVSTVTISADDLYRIS